MERDFEGVFIPENIWLLNDIRLTEKCLLSEILRLQNEGGCQKTNRYFADFLRLSISRISQLVSQLYVKGFIHIDYQYKPDSEELDKRIIRVLTESVALNN